MNVKVELVNKHKSATADLWHYSGPSRFTFELWIVYRDLLFNSFKSVVRFRVRVKVRLAM